MATLTRSARTARKTTPRQKPRAPRRATGFPVVKVLRDDAGLEDLLRPRNAMDFVHIVKRGIPARFVDAAVTRFGIPKERFVVLLHTSKPTINRLIHGDRALDPLVSGAFKDAAQVLEKIREAVGGDQAAMTEWLNSHVPALGTKPIDLLDTPDGRDLVAGTVDRARYGVFG
jgi:putative toxin-antitoxin system antitoxin component (TIGR02293 family)